MATDITALQSSILALIQNGSDSIDALGQLLSPISEYITNQQFVSGLNQVVTAVLQNRDGGSSFDVEDLKLLSTDLGAISSVLSGILIMFGSIPSIQFNFNSTACQDLIFKVFAYIFLMVIPQQIGSTWSVADKTTVVQLTFTIYQLIISSGVAEELWLDIEAYFIKKGWCGCICKGATVTTASARMAVFNKNIPKIKIEISSNMNRIKDFNRLKSTIKSLEAKMDTK